MLLPYLLLSQSRICILSYLSNISQNHPKRGAYMFLFCQLWKCEKVLIIMLIFPGVITVSVSETHQGVLTA